MDLSNLSLTWVFLIFLTLPIKLVTKAQGITSIRLLDLAIRDCTFKSYEKYNKTGAPYNIHLPSNLTGIKVSTARYRCGSLKRYGTKIQEFQLKVGVDVTPCVERVLLVTQNLGHNWSNLYYDNYELLGDNYHLVTPVLGLLGYNAGDDTNFNTQFEVKIQSPDKNGIFIDFTNHTIKKNTTLNETTKMCATFRVDGKVTLEKEVAPNVCGATSNGHFGLVVQAAAVGGGGKIKRWKVVVGSSIGAAIGGSLLGLLLIAMFVKVKKKARMEELERRAYEEEALQVSMVGHVIRPRPPPPPRRSPNLITRTIVVKHH